MKNDATQVTLSRWTSEAMTAPTLHAQVLALRRTHSARAEALGDDLPPRYRHQPGQGRGTGCTCEAAGD